MEGPLSILFMSRRYEGRSMTAAELAVSQEDGWRNIAIALIDLWGDNSQVV